MAEKTQQAARADQCTTDFAKLRGRHQVEGRLLAAREELLQAMFLARQRGYLTAGQVLEDHIGAELEPLLARVLPLLQQTENPDAYEARLRSARAASAQSGGSHP